MIINFYRVGKVSRIETNINFYNSLGKKLFYTFRLHEYPNFFDAFISHSFSNSANYSPVQHNPKRYRLIPTNYSRTVVASSGYKYCFYGSATN
jgi:hypothetical protein